MFRRGAGLSRNDSDSARSTVKQGIFFAVRAIVSVLLVWWLFSRIDLTPVAEAAGRMSAGPMIAAFIVTVLATVVLALRWLAVSRVLKMPLAAGRAMWLTFVGLFFSQVLPSTIGGDVVRVAILRRDGISIEQAAVTVILDRLSALVALLVVVGFSVPTLFALIDDPVARWSMPAAVLLGAVGIVVLIALGSRLGVVVGRWRFLRPFVALGRGTYDLARSGSRLLLVVTLALALLAGTVLVIWLIAESIAADLSLLHCIVLVPPVILISMIPISIAGWGVREGAMVVALGFVDVPAADALVISLAFGILLIAAGLPGGVLWLLSGQRVRPENS